MAREGSETAAQREGSLWQDKPVRQDKPVLAGVTRGASVNAATKRKSSQVS